MSEKIKLLVEELETLQGEIQECSVKHVDMSKEKEEAAGAVKVIGKLMKENSDHVQPLVARCQEIRTEIERIEKAAPEPATVPAGDGGATDPALA